MNTETARTVTRLLELVVNGRMSADEALAQWPLITDAEPAFGIAWHDLSHFAADNDIRQKDKRYADYQIGVLTKHIAEIKQMYGLA